MSLWFNIINIVELDFLFWFLVVVSVDFVEGVSNVGMVVLYCVNGVGSKWYIGIDFVEFVCLFVDYDGDVVLVKSNS